MDSLPDGSGQHQQPALQRRNDQAARHIRPKLLEVAQVPGVDPVSICFYSARGDERIIDGPDDDPACGCILYDGEAGGTLKADQAKAVIDVLQTFDGLLRRSAMRGRQACQG